LSRIAELQQHESGALTIARPPHDASVPASPHTLKRPKPTTRRCAAGTPWWVARRRPKRPAAHQAATYSFEALCTGSFVAVTVARALGRVAHSAPRDRSGRTNLLVLRAGEYTCRRCSARCAIVAQQQAAHVTLQCIWALQLSGPPNNCLRISRCSQGFRPPLPQWSLARSTRTLGEPPGVQAKLSGPSTPCSIPIGHFVPPHYRSVPRCCLHCALVLAPSSLVLTSGSFISVSWLRLHMCSARAIPSLPQ
jgi:hypothetical protein